MIVGALRLRLRMAENHSLKEKRGIVRSLIARLQNRYQVAAAEVGDNDVWQTAEVGVACVSNAASHAEEVLNKVITFVESERLDVEVVDHEIEILHLT